MERIYRDMTQLIGRTPLLRMERIMEEQKVQAQILAKLEYFNPAGSVKDRAALSMIRDAEKSGRLQPGGTIIEPTSGNTGIGLAAIAAVKGYHTVFVMPENMSVERRKLLTAYGGEVVLTEAEKGMAGAIEKADQLAEELDGAFVMGQFVNPANPAAHYRSTGPEIWEDTAGKVDVFVAGVGTGGTITGTGRYLKEKSPGIEIIAVEPDTSAVLSGKPAGAHGIQGIGAGFVPKALDTCIYDRVIRVADTQALFYARMAARLEGTLVGISSGAALCAAVKLGQRKEYAQKRIVVLMPDTGERYLSTELFD